MKLLLILFLLPNSSFAKTPESNDDYFINAYFYENATFQGYWNIEVKTDLSVISEYIKSMISMDSEKQKDKLTISSYKLESLCNNLNNIGFRKLPETVSPKFVMIDGPSFGISIKCDNLVHRVDYYPDMSNKLTKEAFIFESSWSLIWALTKIEAPKFEKYRN